MDVIFVHGNYPGQFRNLAPMIGGSNNRVYFLTERQDAYEEKMNGVEIRILESHRAVGNTTHHYLRETEEGIIKGQSVVRSLDKLIREGVEPRIIITHAGNGLGTFVKSFIPNAIHIGYFEWYFREKTTKHLVKNFDLDTKLMTEMRNLNILHELESCDVAVVPTEWQKNQFPQNYQNKIKVIFDGIDLTFFHPKKRKKKENNEIILQNRETGTCITIPKNKRIISYATRGMEPLRGFPELMDALPKVLKKNNDLIAVIAGADRVAYSYPAPTKSGSWKEYMINKIEDKEIRKRIKFTGLLNYQDYRELLWRTDLHCYFTHPYVTSWSLFEATACGANLAINENQATNYIADKESVTWVDPFDPNKLANQLNNTLNKKTKKIASLMQGFDLKDNIKSWEILLNSSLIKQRESK